MIDLIEHILFYVRQLLSLLADEKLTKYFGGANLLYIFVALWVSWQLINFFLLRPMPGGSLNTKGGSSAAASQEENVNE